MERGTRNLILLGLLAIGIAGVTSGISLVVYHKSGDIYLDRSRPGFLPDEDEEQRPMTETKYTFPETGEVDQRALEEYLREIKTYTEGLEKITEPFSEKPLLDNSLGIPEERVEEE